MKIHFGTRGKSPSIMIQVLRSHVIFEWRIVTRITAFTNNKSRAYVVIFGGIRISKDGGKFIRVVRQTYRRPTSNRLSNSDRPDAEGRPQREQLQPSLSHHAPSRC